MIKRSNQKLVNRNQTIRFAISAVTHGGEQTEAYANSSKILNMIIFLI